MGVEVPLGDGHVDLTLDGSVTVARPPGGDPVDVRERAQLAVAEPHGPRLAAQVDPGDDVGIVVTDLTRATPDAVLLDALLAELERGGVPREQVTVVVGLGLHRPMTDDELAAALGEHADLAVNHDPDRTVEVGRVDGCPVTLFEPLADADLVCSTGMVEPHQYAGFSGGAKTAVIGAGGEPQIRYTHGPDLLGREGVRLGRIADNPFRSFLDRAGDAVGVTFCLNVTHTPPGTVGVSAGEPRRVVADLATRAREALAVEVTDAYDAVVAGVGAPKDASLYQASRAATYVALGAHNPLRAGGRLVVPAELPEAAGQGTGERRFREWLSAATDPASLYERMAAGYEPGAQRAFVLARVLREHPVTVTDSTCPDLVERCLLDAAPTVEAALDPTDDVLVVPDALHTLLVSA
jgi:nickel-dependent lactate racemase